MDSKPARRFQFSVVTALCLVTAVAILCALTRWEGGFPYGAVLPGILFVAACYFARWERPPELAWGFFAIAWTVALIGVVTSQIRCFGVESVEPLSGVGISEFAARCQACLFQEYVSGVALPLFLSLPAAYLAIKASRGTRSYARKWMIACAIIGLADVTALTILIGFLFRSAWP